MASKSTSTGLLREKLAQVLPKGFEFTVHHLSTLPTATEPLCLPLRKATNSAKPQSSAGSAANEIAIEDRHTEPLKTYCEKQFLTVSVKDPASDRQVLALALEIYIYSTVHSTTLFVSKADSTGYLSLLQLPKGAPSPIREVTAAFVSFLIEHRRRRSRQFVVNLFARAQNQYLFPRSVDNGKKHVLDDRGLVKWWCRVLDPLIKEGKSKAEARKAWEHVKGYLIIPGLDHYETRAFLPRTQTATVDWTLGHPLEQISPYFSEKNQRIPPRSLIPQYPDDPKARFVQELEETYAEKRSSAGEWSGVRTLEQFWEMMAFRQECSSGRMTGFIWIVLNPKKSTPLPSSTTSSLPTPNASFHGSARPSTPPPALGDVDQPQAGLVTPRSSQVQSVEATPVKPRTKKTPKSKKSKKLQGHINPRRPQVKTSKRNYIPDIPIKTRHYYWPDEGRGQVVVKEADYKRSVELLLHLDFGSLELAANSSTRWTAEVGVGERWGQSIVGQKETAVQASLPAAGAVNNLTGLIKKRKAPGADAEAEGASAPTVNVLNGGLVRKKPRQEAPEAEQIPQVNVLGAGLVRKKPKAT